MGNKTSNTFKRNPLCKGCFIVSKLNVVLQSGLYETPLGFDIVDWFLADITKLEIKLAHNDAKEVIMAHKEEQH